MMEKDLVLPWVSQPGLPGPLRGTGPGSVGTWGALHTPGFDSSGNNRDSSAAPVEPKRPELPGHPAWAGASFPTRLSLHQTNPQGLSLPCPRTAIPASDPAGTAPRDTGPQSHILVWCPRAGDKRLHKNTA